MHKAAAMIYSSMGSLTTKPVFYSIELNNYQSMWLAELGKTLAINKVLTIYSSYMISQDCKSM